jgi:hypothetical protein
MAEGRSLTTREVVEVLASEHSDVLPSRWPCMVREIMEFEVARLAGAEFGRAGSGPPGGAAKRVSRPAVGAA